MPDNETTSRTKAMHTQQTGGGGERAPNKQSGLVDQPAEGQTAWRQGQGGTVVQGRQPDQASQQDTSAILDQVEPVGKTGLPAKGVDAEGNSS